MSGTGALWWRTTVLVPSTKATWLSNSVLNIAIDAQILAKQSQHQAPSKIAIFCNKIKLKLFVWKRRIELFLLWEKAMQLPFSDRTSYFEPTISYTFTDSYSESPLWVEMIQTQSMGSFIMNTDPFIAKFQPLIAKFTGKFVNF